MIYLNMKTAYGIETIDECEREEGQTPKEFRKQLNELIHDYKISGHPVYKSSRCTKEWKNK